MVMGALGTEDARDWLAPTGEPLRATVCCIEGQRGNGAMVALPFAASFASGSTSATGGILDEDASGCGCSAKLPNNLGAVITGGVGADSRGSAAWKTNWEVGEDGDEGLPSDITSSSSTAATLGTGDLVD